MYVYIYIYTYTHKHDTLVGVHRASLLCVVYHLSWTYHLRCYYKQNDIPVDVHGAALLCYLSVIDCYYDNFIVCFIIDLLLLR